MEINRRQRKVLVACGSAVVAMLLYPPLQFRGVGQGYGWIFATESGQAINASQLLVQWLAVGIVGAIAFVLASGVHPKPSSASWPGLRHVLQIAYRNSRTWRWILLSAVGISVAMVFAGLSQPVRVIGKILAALFLYACIFLWHCWNARRGEQHVQAEGAISWRWVSVAVLAILIVVGAVIGWEFVTQRTSGRVVYDDEEVFFGANPTEAQTAKSGKPWERSWDKDPRAALANQGARAQSLNPAQIKQIEEIAQTIASQHNANATALLDEMTVSTRAVAAARNVRFENVLKVKKGLPPAKLKEFSDEIQREIAPKSCAVNAKNPAFDQGLTYTFAYTNTYGEKLAEFTVDKAVCGRYK